MRPLIDTLSDCYRQPGPSAAYGRMAHPDSSQHASRYISKLGALVKAMGNKKRGVKAKCANVQKAREADLQHREQQLADIQRLQHLQQQLQDLKRVCEAAVLMDWANEHPVVRCHAQDISASHRQCGHIMLQRYLVLDDARQAAVCSMIEADGERMHDDVEGCRAMQGACLVLREPRKEQQAQCEL
ncbi:hypothetical protein HaLaN_01558, partial [Haematococcus lacustris]